MKPIALITRYVNPAVIDLLTSVCEVAGDAQRGALNEVLQPVT